MPSHSPQAEARWVMGLRAAACPRLLTDDLVPAISARVVELFASRSCVLSSVLSRAWGSSPSSSTQVTHSTNGSCFPTLPLHKRAWFDPRSNAFARPRLPRTAAPPCVQETTATPTSRTRTRSSNRVRSSGSCWERLPDLSRRGRRRARGDLPLRPAKARRGRVARVQVGVPRRCLRMVGQQGA